MIRARKQEAGLPAITMQQVNGIPVLGLGTYPLRGSEALRAVTAAVEIGFRHIDTAQMYGNERDIGRAIAVCGVPRNELYVVTKVDPGNLGPSRFSSSVARSMQDLGGPADLLLIHWPPPENDFDATVDRLIAEKEKGMAANVGVSNFSVSMMQRAQQRAKGAIICNQVEFHPLLDGGPLLAAATETGIPLAAFCTLARGEILKYPLLAEIGSAHGKTAAQVGLRWTLQKGVALTTMSTSFANIRANFEIMNFALSVDEMARIDTLNTVNHRIITRAGGVPWAAEW